MRTMLKGRLSLLFLTLAVMLAFPAMALADQLANAVDDSLDGTFEEMAIETGGKTQETLIYVVPVDGDGGSGACNFDQAGDKAAVTVASSATSVATAKWKSNNSATIDFTGCGAANGKTLVVTSGSAASEASQTDSIDPAQITFSTVDAFGRGNLQTNFARFRVLTSAPAPSNTPPSVSVTGVQAGASYELGSVPAASCSVTDTEDTGESATPVFDNSGLNSHGLGPVQVTCSYTDGGGLNETASATYTIQDTGKPTSSHQLSAAANASGWHKENVTVSLSGSDNTNGSGLKEIRYSATGAQTINDSVYNSNSKPVISSEGETTFKYYAVDNAGNTQAEQSFTVKLDKTAPVITDEGPTSQPNANGWYKANVTNSFSASDNLSGLANPAQASISQTTSGEGPDRQVSSGAVSDVAGNTNPGVDSDTFKVDKTAPSVAYKSASPAANAAGWNNTNVTATFEATDSLSGMGATDADKSATGTSVASDEGNNVTVGSPAFTDRAGNTAAAGAAPSVSFKIDKTAPSVSAVPERAPDRNGWYNHAVTFSFEGQDGLSGVARCSDDRLYGGPDDRNITVNGTCTDVAGNTSDPASTSFDYDATAPSITDEGPTSQPNANGWYKANVTNSFSASDNLSGLANPAQASISQTTSGEGPDRQVSSGAVSDVAGNTNPGVDSDTFKVDKTAPSVAATGNVNGTAGNAGWYTSAIDVEFRASDGLSGFVNKTDPFAFTRSSETQQGDAVNVSSGSVTDKAGNDAVAVSSGPFKVDYTAPTLNPSVSPNPVILNGSATASANAADAHSGVASQSCDPVNTNSVGSKSVSCSATDVAGNSDTGSANYTVQYNFGGFLQPINYTAHQVLNTNVSTFKAGSTVPAKFKLTDANGNVVQSATAPQWTVPQKGSATTQAVDEAVFTDVATNGTAYRYDATAQQFIYNWSTKGVAANFYYKIGVKLDDGQTYYTYISLR